MHKLFKNKFFYIILTCVILPLIVSIILKYIPSPAPAKTTEIKDSNFEKSPLIINSPGSNISINNGDTHPTLIPNKIKLSERYAYEFDNYLGSTGEAGNNTRIIEQNAILRKPYTLNNKVRITPAIANLNERIPLKQARIQFIFDQGVIVKDYQGWVEQEVNSRYSFKFGEPINNVPLNTSNSLFVSFPEPGRYKIKALIDGEYLEGVKEVNYFIELYE